MPPTKRKPASKRGASRTSTISTAAAKRRGQKAAATRARNMRKTKRT